MSVYFLTVDDLLQAADIAVRPAQSLLRDPGALAACAARPQTTVFGEDAYPGLADRVAALMHSIVRNHPLVDGNKRLAWYSARLFCQLNGHDLGLAEVDEAEEFVLRMARGELDVDEAVKVIAPRLRELD